MALAGWTCRPLVTGREGHLSLPVLLAAGLTTLYFYPVPSYHSHLLLRRRKDNDLRYLLLIGWLSAGMMTHDERPRRRSRAVGTRSVVMSRLGLVLLLALSSCAAKPLPITTTTTTTITATAVVNKRRTARHNKSRVRPPPCLLSREAHDAKFSGAMLSLQLYRKLRRKSILEDASSFFPTGWTARRSPRLRRCRPQYEISGGVHFVRVELYRRLLAGLEPNPATDAYVAALLAALKLNVGPALARGVCRRQLRSASTRCARCGRSLQAPRPRCLKRPRRCSSCERPMRYCASSARSSSSPPRYWSRLSRIGGSESSRARGSGGCVGGSRAVPSSRVTVSN